MYATYINAAARLANSLGIKVSVGKPADGSDGQYYWDNARPIENRPRWITFELDYDNPDDSLYLFLHELGHALLGHEQVIDNGTVRYHGDYTQAYKRVYKLVEREADSVAVAVWNLLGLGADIEWRILWHNHGLTSCERINQVARYIVRHIQ